MPLTFLHQISLLLLLSFIYQHVSQHESYSYAVIFCIKKLTNTYLILEKLAKESSTSSNYFWVYQPNLSFCPSVFVIVGFRCGFLGSWCNSCSSLWFLSKIHQLQEAVETLQHGEELESLQFLPAENMTWSDTSRVRKKAQPFHSLDTRGCLPVPCWLALAVTHSVISALSLQGRLHGP